jgi:hypothetical protein
MPALEETYSGGRLATQISQGSTTGLPECQPSRKEPVQA